MVTPIINIYINIFFRIVILVENRNEKLYLRKKKTKTSRIDMEYARELVMRSAVRGSVVLHGIRVWRVNLTWFCGFFLIKTRFDKLHVSMVQRERERESRKIFKNYNNNNDDDDVNAK